MLQAETSSVKFEKPAPKGAVTLVDADNLDELVNLLHNEAKVDLILNTCLLNVKKNIMSVLVYTESEQGKFKKTAFEVASYAKAVADQLGTTVTAITINAGDSSDLGNYGVDKVLNVSNADLDTFNAKSYASAITKQQKRRR